jgi:hypothetical protein
MLSNTCSANEKIGDDCFDDKLIDLNNFEEYLTYLSAGQFVLTFHSMLKKGSKPNEAMLSAIKEKSEWLIQNIEKYPTAAGTIGLGISILFLYDSLADDATKNIIKEYNDLLETPINDFATEKAYHKHIFKDTNRIRRHVMELKARKLERIIFKTIFAFVFGWIGWVTNAVVLKPLAYIASLFGLIAGGIDAHHLIQLNNLAKAFEKTGYII